ncbi:YceI family protein [Pedobacter boryungensis]|uniref:YceI family protein n=1 Tax=Pedobacter boryungensis TaxID=869962 RepID=A0ABX2DCB7_9SPHI|nr:YceI family protein [Pedobacter boryungensis]NQX31590.1 YceI family protein [Pedobacter boryungensis]
MMIIKAFLLLLALTVPNFNKPIKNESKWVIAENSTLRVNGSTNINRFSCAILNYPKTDTVTINTEVGKQIALQGRVSLNLKSFDCNNIIMTKQLRKTLKEEQYPFLHVNFLSLKGIPITEQTDNGVKGIVEIELAGIKRRFLIFYQIKTTSNGMTLSGCQAITFSDFKLVPPQKMGKLIQAKDQLKVDFELNLQQAK